MAIHVCKGLDKKYGVWGGEGAFGNVFDKKKTHGLPPPFGTKMTNPPLKQGWKLHDPLPSIKTWMFGFLLIIR